MMWVKFKEWDRKLFFKCYQKPIQWSRFRRTLLIFGDIPIWVIISTILMLVGGISQSLKIQTTTLHLWLGIFLSGIFLIIPKSTIHRIRPYADSELQDSFGEVCNRDPAFARKSVESFPSGHTFLTFMGLIIFTIHFGWIGFIGFGWIALPMPIYRCNLGAHYPSDTIAGILLGISAAIVGNLILMQITDSTISNVFQWFFSPSGIVGWVLLGVLIAFIIFVGKKRK